MEQLLANEIDRLEQVSADPTLESCCRKDLEEQLYIAKCKAVLVPQDKSEMRRRMTAQTILVPQNAPGLDEGGDELDVLRGRRMQELRAEASRREALRIEGHGLLTSVSPQKLQHELESGTADCVVCHIAPGNETSADLDELLDSLAHRYVGTRFLRCSAPWSSNLYPKYQIPTGGIVCLKKDTVVGTLPLPPQDIDLPKVQNWLQRFKCLIEASGSTPKHLGKPHQPSSAEESEGESDNEDEWNVPCVECGRQYIHVHVRSVYRKEHPDSDSDLD